MGIGFSLVVQAATEVFPFTTYHSDFGSSFGSGVAIAIDPTPPIHADLSAMP